MVNLPIGQVATLYPKTGDVIGLAMVAAYLGLLGFGCISRKRKSQMPNSDQPAACQRLRLITIGLFFPKRPSDQCGHGRTQDEHRFKCKKLIGISRMPGALQSDFHGGDTGADQNIKNQLRLD